MDNWLDEWREEWLMEGCVSAGLGQIGLRVRMGRLMNFLVEAGVGIKGACWMPGFSRII